MQRASRFVEREGGHIDVAHRCVRGGDLGGPPFITKSNNPKGGVVKLISSASSMISANQIGSNPSCVASGKKIGTVSSIMEICSMNMPRISSTANMASSIAMGARSKEVAHSISPRDAPEKARTG
jgi:hypothetical protein